MKIKNNLWVLGGSSILFPKLCFIFKFIKTKSILKGKQFCLLFMVKLSLHPQLLANTNLFYNLTVLSFPEYQVSGIINYIIFWSWLLLLSLMSIYVGKCVNCLFYLNSIIMNVEQILSTVLPYFVLFDV